MFGLQLISGGLFPCSHFILRYSPTTCIHQPGNVRLRHLGEKSGFDFVKNRRGSHNDQGVTLPDHDVKMDRGLRHFENHSMCSCFAATVVLLPAGGTREFSFITLVQFLPVILPECRDVDFVRLP